MMSGKFSYSPPKSTQNVGQDMLIMHDDKNALSTFSFLNPKNDDGLSVRQSERKSGSNVIVEVNECTSNLPTQKINIPKQSFEEINKDLVRIHHTKETLVLKLRKVRERLEKLRLQNENEKKARIIKTCDILINQVPSYSAHKDIPPLLIDVVETQDRIGPYNLETCISTGGFAKVFRAKHAENGTFHAIKRLNKRHYQSIKDIAQLGREIRVITSEVHKNVIECSEVINGTKFVYLVMELSVCDLHTYYRQWRTAMSECIVREIARGILEGVECLHSIGVAHLDLKPENILLLNNVEPRLLTRSDVKICDLGLCAISEKPNDEIRVEGMRGTPGFTSPEMQLLQNGFTVEGRMCDIWSFGVVLLEILEGISPHWFIIYSNYRRNRHDAAFTRQLRRELCMIKCGNGRRSEGKDLVCRMLRWEPQDRISAKEALLHPWFKMNNDK
jgi:tRNA A-37 threonylcarbamoyl transferase component Bud32